MSGYLYRSVKSDYFDARADIFGIDHYRKGNRGEDDFSREQVWFYVYGDEDLKQKFGFRFLKMFRDIFEEDIVDWDIATLYPTHVKGKVNPHMAEIMKEIDSETGMEYRQLIHRTETIRENHEMYSVGKKAVNVRDSIEVEDVEGSNVVVVDNISLSGSSLLHAVERLKQQGAEKVVCACLGLGYSGRALDRHIKDMTASEAVESSRKIVKADSLARERVEI